MSSDMKSVPDLKRGQ